MLTLTRPIDHAFAHILTKDALDFVEKLVKKFQPKQMINLDWRTRIQAGIKNGQRPDFLSNTRAISQSEWTVPTALGTGLVDRRVEITGPASNRKMVINAYNSGAKVFMADFEDSESPTWQNLIQGQVNLYDAVRGTISYESPERKRYELNLVYATLMVRPRGLHLFDYHVMVDGRYPVSASLLDFGLFFFHNAKERIADGFGPYFYLPKIESYHEAQWWADVFAYAEELLGITTPVTKATVLIETILAAFQMNEIIYALRDYSAGLNCGRWDYIFSFIKKFGHDENFVMPDRSVIGMDQHFLKSYATLLVETCHRRGVHAIGGMSAYIPVKDDAVENVRALTKVQDDKLREVHQMFDGTWVAHPGLVGVAQAVFDQFMKQPNWLAAARLNWTDKKKEVTAADLLTVPSGTISAAGVRTNIRVAITYIESWLRGIGCVPIDNLMEDMATAEISRTQLWQWLHQRSLYQMRPDGWSPTAFGVEQFEFELQQSLEEIKNHIGLEKMLAGKYLLAIEALRQLVRMPEPVEFLPQWLYQLLLKEEEAHHVR